VFADWEPSVPRWWRVWGVFGGCAAALAAEAIALVALVLSAPPDWFAAVVLGGAGVLLAALVVSLGAFVEAEFRAPYDLVKVKPEEKGGHSSAEETDAE
jgi:hypothetical protein